MQKIEKENRIKEKQYLERKWAEKAQERLRKIRERKEWT